MYYRLSSRKYRLKFENFKANKINYLVRLSLSSMPVDLNVGLLVL
jgi:hypothetical protein